MDSPNFPATVRLVHANGANGYCEKHSKTARKMLTDVFGVEDLTEQPAQEGDQCQMCVIREKIRAEQSAARTKAWP